jgi:hypothetical protein
MLSKEKFDKFNVTKLIGSTQERLDLYNNPYCPENDLLEAAKAIQINFEESKTLSDFDQKLISNLVKNQSTPTEAILILDSILQSQPSILCEVIKRQIYYPAHQSDTIAQIKYTSGYEKLLTLIFGNKPELLDTFLENSFLSGTSLTNFINRLKINDFDFFIKNSEAALLIANHLISQLPVEFHNIHPVVNPDGSLYFNNLPKMIKTKLLGIDIILSQNAITFKENPKTLGLNYPIQFIFRHVGSPEAVTETFDFAHCKIYFDLSKNNIYYPPVSYQSAFKKQLIYTGQALPLNSLFRSKLFISRGWTLTNEELLKIAFKLSKTNLSDPAVVRESIKGFYNIQVKENSTDRTYNSNLKTFDEYFHDKKEITFEDLCDYILETYESPRTPKS